MSSECVSGCVYGVAISVTRIKSAHVRKYFDAFVCHEKTLRSPHNGIVRRTRYALILFGAVQCL